MKKPSTTSEPDGLTATPDTRPGRLTPVQSKARRERHAALGIKPIDPTKLGTGFAIIGVSPSKMRSIKK